MNIVYFLLPLALLLGSGFLMSFVAAAKRGQYDDLETPAHRMLLDEDPITANLTNSKNRPIDSKGHAREYDGRE